MLPNLWTRKGVVLMAAIVTFACVAALLSVSLTSPDPISSAALGADWQCSRFAFVFTICTPPVQAAEAAAAIRVRENSVCPRPQADGRPSAGESVSAAAAICRRGI